MARVSNGNIISVVCLNCGFEFEEILETIPVTPFDNSKIKAERFEPSHCQGCGRKIVDAYKIPGRKLVGVKTL